MNKLQSKGGYKTQRKRNMKAVGLPEVTAGKLSHAKNSEHGKSSLERRREKEWIQSYIRICPE